MSAWENLWKFETARFKVTLDWEWEQYPDISWDETDETRENLESGKWGCYSFRVRVTVDGRELSVDYLGNSIYEDVTKFVTAHRDPNPMNRNCSIMRAARGGNVCICHYFPGMVSEAISAARKALCDVPRVRCA